MVVAEQLCGTLNDRFRRASVVGRSPMKRQLLA